MGLPDDNPSSGCDFVNLTPNWIEFVAGNDLSHLCSDFVNSEWKGTSTDISRPFLLFVNIGIQYLFLKLCFHDQDPFSLSFFFNAATKPPTSTNTAIIKLSNNKQSKHQFI
jgi:hypothetical protein